MTTSVHQLKSRIGAARYNEHRSSNDFVMFVTAAQPRQCFCVLAYRTPPSCSGTAAPQHFAAALPLCGYCLSALLCKSHRHCQLFYTRLLLEETENTENHRMLSASQAAAIVETVQSTEDMTATIKAEISAVVVGIKWHSQGDRTKVLESLAPAAATVLPPGKRRRCQQDFASIRNYGDEQFWEMWSKPCSAPAKLSNLLQLAIRLGLRCPTEPTMKWLTSVWVCNTTPLEELQAMDPSVKGVMLKHAKASFDALRRVAPEPAEFIQVLPAEPAAYVRDHKRMFVVAFPTSTPIATRLDVATAMAFDQSYGCRGSTRTVQFGGGVPRSTLSSGASSSAVPLLQLSPRRSEALAMERVASQVMKQMETMAQQQQRLFEFMLGQSSGGLRLPRCLDDRRPQPQLAIEFGNTQPLADLQPQGSGTAVLQILPKHPQDSVAATTPPGTAVAGSATSPCTAKATTPTHTADPAAPKPSADSAIDDLLDSFIARRSAKAKAASAATGGDAKPEAAAFAKAKVKAKASAGTAGKAELASPPPLSGSAKAKTRVAVAANHHAKAKGKAAGLILGCSKCRRAVTGCGQCRNPEFAGFRWNPTLG